MNIENQEKFAELTAKWLISQLKNYIAETVTNHNIQNGDGTSEIQVNVKLNVDKEGLRSDIKYKMERLFESLDDSYEKTQCPSKEQLVKAFHLLKTRGCLTWEKDKNAEEVIKHWDDDKVKTDDDKV